MEKSNCIKDINKEHTQTVPFKTVPRQTIPRQEVPEKHYPTRHYQDKPKPDRATRTNGRKTNSSKANYFFTQTKAPRKNRTKTKSSWVNIPIQMVRGQTVPRQ